MSLIESITLGTIQGVAEWLPVSSEGLIVLAEVVLFGHEGDIASLVSTALFLHLGTFFAALVYFRKDVLRLLSALASFKRTDIATQKTFVFLLISTLISGTLGLVLLKAVEGLEDFYVIDGSAVMLGIGILLLITAFLQFFSKRLGSREEKDLNFLDGIILGITQALAALPGISRSGSTVALLLIRKLNEESALKLSFLMSLPIVLAGNVILNIETLTFTINNAVALLFSFVFGLLTIDGLLKIARKINFGYFVLIFGILTIAAAFV